jgi:outer membrane lipoprotein-sorting protein
MEELMNLARIGLMCLSFSLTAYSADPSADEILKKADNVRNPLDSFKMNVEVVNDDNEKTSFDVLTKGKDKTVIRTTFPAKDKGRNMLMLKEDMWLYLPNLNKSVRVGLNQKLTGQAANGDICRMRWHGDYKVKIEKSTPKEWVLFLEAERKGLTYDKIRLFVEKSNFRPKKAEYLNLSGQTLKNAIFSNYKTLVGEMRPTEIKISDVKSDASFSVVKIRQLEKATFQDSIFQQTNLR